MSTAHHLVIGMEPPLAPALTAALQHAYGMDTVWGADDLSAVPHLLKKYGITDTYLVTGVLAPNTPEPPATTWHRHTRQLLTLLDMAHKTGVKVFWPSSIVVFGPAAPPDGCPDDAPQEACSFFAIAKRAGEQWCRQYRREHGVDVRCLRFPVLLRSAPGANRIEPTPAFLLPQPRPVLPLDDAVRATIELMAAPAVSIRETGIYHLAGVSVSVAELMTEIQFHYPQTRIEIWNLPDHPGPMSLDDSAARADWGWKPRYDLLHLVKNLLQTR